MSDLIEKMSDLPEGDVEELQGEEFTSSWKKVGSGCGYDEAMEAEGKYRRRRAEMDEV